MYRDSPAPASVKLSNIQLRLTPSNSRLFPSYLGWYTVHLSRHTTCTGIPAVAWSVGCTQLWMKRMRKFSVLSTCFINMTII